MAVQAQIFTKQLDLSESLIHLLAPTQHTLVFSIFLGALEAIGRVAHLLQFFCFALPEKARSYSILFYSVLFDFSLIPASVHVDASSSLSILATRSLSSRGRGTLEGGPDSDSDPPSVFTVAVVIVAASVLDLARIS